MRRHPRHPDRLDLSGALVTIGVIACDPAVAKAATDREGDYLLAVKADQPTLFGAIGRYFDDTAAKLLVWSDLDKGHGRLETRRYAVSHEVGWLAGDRRYPDEPRFAKLTAIAMVEATVEKAGTTSTRRLHLSPDGTPMNSPGSLRHHPSTRTRCPGIAPQTSCMFARGRYVRSCGKSLGQIAHGMARLRSLYTYVYP